MTLQNPKLFFFGFLIKLYGVTVLEFLFVRRMVRGKEQGVRTGLRVIC